MWYEGMQHINTNLNKQKQTKPKRTVHLTKLSLFLIRIVVTVIVLLFSPGYTYIEKVFTDCFATGPHGELLLVIVTVISAWMLVWAIQQYIIETRKENVNKRNISKSC